MTERVSIFIDQQTLEAKIAEVAAQINKDYAGRSIHLICILKGSSFFACQLAKHLTIPTTIDFMSISSYGSGTVSSGIVRLSKDLDEPVEGKNVLIVEDIIDSGRTLAHLKNLLSTRKPASLSICTLLDKPDRRVLEIDADYTCFQIPDKFVVGYGLDYDQKYRNLPFIGVVEFVEE
ncbi:MAG: hypoxanthine phosphoribosyltransferase [Lachnospiraceae bacterium]|nr:hypoxanthine phosphoribosyltransferase [Lachnospiraceae bacterium]